MGDRRRYAIVKRLGDIAVALVALAALWPVMLVIAGLVALRLGRPVLFRQTRPGLHGRPFTLLKFRSMHPVDTTRGRVADGDRLGRFGRILRASSLDELPSLVNVLRGDMSLVGPRPLLMEYLARYTPEEHRRHEVRPGVTGLAQVSGRNNAAWDLRLRRDVEYVDAYSLRLDVSIVVQTIGMVLRRADVVSTGHATGREFRPADSRRAEPEYPS